MAVYFVYRAHDNGRAERFVRRFEADTVLDWFRSIWKAIPDENAARQHAWKLFGGLDAWMFGYLFLCIAEEELPPPEDMGEVRDGFRHVYVPEENHGPHHLQIVIEAGDIEEAIYLFDDHFRAMHPGLTDFLLLDGWELPDAWSDTASVVLPDCERQKHPGDREGTLYAVDLFVDCKYNLTDLDGGMRVDGARVEDLCRYVLTHPDADRLIGYGLRSLHRTLREMLEAPSGEDAGFLTAIRDHPGEPVHWAVYSDWLQERGLPPAGIYLLEAALRAAKLNRPRDGCDPALDLVKVTSHLAQASKHEAKEKASEQHPHRDVFTQWIFFDDRWAAAHPILAEGLLRYAARWDVLTVEPD